MELRLVELLGEKRQLVVVVKQEATPGNNTCGVQHVQSIMEMSYHWLRVSILASNYCGAMIVTLESGALSLNETAFRRYIYFARGSGRERSRRVQAPAEKAAYSGDRMLRCIWWTERSEVFAETDVAVQRLLGGDDPL